MKLKKIEPVLQQMTDAMRMTKKPIFKNIDHDKALKAMESLLRRVVRANDKIRKKSEQPKNHGAAWTDKRKKRLINFIIKEFDPINETRFYDKAAKKFGRTSRSIYGQLTFLELVKYPYDAEFSRKALQRLKSTHQ